MIKVLNAKKFKTDSSHTNFNEVRSRSPALNHLLFTGVSSFLRIENRLLPGGCRDNSREIRCLQGRSADKPAVNVILVKQLFGVLRVH